MQYPTFFQTLKVSAQSMPAYSRYPGRVTLQRADQYSRRCEVVTCRPRKAKICPYSKKENYVYTYESINYEIDQTYASMTLGVNFFGFNDPTINVRSS